MYFPIFQIVAQYRCAGTRTDHQRIRDQSSEAVRVECLAPGVLQGAGCHCGLCMSCHVVRAPGLEPRPLNEILMRRHQAMYY